MDEKDLQIKALTEALATAQSENRKLVETVSDLRQTVANLNETVDQLRRMIFGSKSEQIRKPEPDPDYEQLTLDIFNEAESCADPAAVEPTPEEVTVSFKKKLGNHKGREAILDGIPVKEVICKTDDTTCPVCGSEMQHTGKKFVREELFIRPAKLLRIRYYQETFSCRACEERTGKKTFLNATVPTPLMPHSLASPTTVAYIMNRKYAFCEPLYRLEKEYQQMGAKLTRGVMSNWIIYCSLHYMKPVYERLHRELLKRDILHGDETPCQVLKEEDRRPQTKSYMWVYTTGNDGLPGITLYDYKPGRGGEYPKKFLKGFKGFFHCDGYQGYNKLEDIERIGCLAHSRRYFYEAVPKGTIPDSTTLAGKGVEYYNKLFWIEKELKGKDPEEIKAIRAAEEAPILEEFFAWLDTLNPAGGSRLEKAVHYSKSQKQNLLGYLKDGRLEISNNACERKCKSYAMGRRNFLFHDTVDGADASAIVYSLVETAKMNGLNTFSYLQNVLLYMPGYQNESEGIEDMMPWSDFMQKSCPKVKPEEHDARPVGME